MKAVKKFLETFGKRSDIDVEQSDLHESLAANEESTTPENTNYKMTSMLSTIKKVTEGVSRLKVHLSQMNSKIDKSTQLLSSTNQRMKEDEVLIQKLLTVIKEMSRAKDSISDLKESIRKINVKTQAINDIVAKTQLLSFNASLEASHAGQYGKGFVVVAEEVGRLAKTSGLAAKEIQNQITVSQGQIDATLSNFEKRFENGLDICREISNGQSKSFIFVNQTQDFLRTLSSECALQRSHADGIEVFTKSINEKINELANVNYRTVLKTQADDDVVSEVNFSEGKELSEFIDPSASLVSAEMNNAVKTSTLDEAHGDDDNIRITKISENTQQWIEKGKNVSVSTDEVDADDPSFSSQE
jgi:methyl-accepting chemotaxis protein